MKISLNEIKKLVKIPEGIDDQELVRLIGARLVEVEEVDDWTEKFRHIKIVRVETCEPIPDTHLHLCQINTGNSNTVQVVCGAPNVHAGMLAVWLAPGAIIPCTFGKEHIKIQPRKLRGYESNGMLAAADELGLGDDHTGIIEIDPEMDYKDDESGEIRKVRPGDSFADVFGLWDSILDIENKSLTHRPDCFGYIGFAREVAGILGVKFDEQAATARLNFDGQISRSENPSTLAIEIADTDLCPRYSAAVVNFASEPSSKYFTKDDVFLIKSGMHPISPIVDMTNKIMLETGQPLHAFDYDKFVKVGGTDQPKIIVRAARPGEKLELLDGKTIECDENDILITSNDVPVALAGAMGGMNTAIDEHTDRIIIESATFSLYHLRKTQMKHGIFSEAITRFTKGQPAGQTMLALDAALDSLGVEPEEIVDFYPEPAKTPPIEVSVSEINSLLGTSYDEKLIVKTLENVGLTCDFDMGGVEKSRDDGSSEGGTERGSASSSAARPWRRAGRTRPEEEPSSDPSRNPMSKLWITVPYWRTDLHIKEDIIEEVGRLLGFDNIPLSFPTRPFIGAKVDPMLELKNRIRDILSDRLGAHEVLTYSFVSKSLQEKFGEDPQDSYEIVNSISPELQCFRQSLTPSLLEKVQENQKAGYKDFALYEINQISKKSFGLTNEDVPVMKTHLALVTTGDFYQAKAYLTELCRELNVNGFSEGGAERGSKQVGDPRGLFSGDTCRAPRTEVSSAHRGVVGKHVAGPENTQATAPWDAEGRRPTSRLATVPPSIAKKLKLESPISYFEFALDDIVDTALDEKSKSLRFSRFPSVSRDVTFKVSEDTPYAAVETALNRALEKTKLIYKIEPVSIYEPEQNLKKTKNLSFHIILNSEEKTLNSNEISDIMNGVTNKTCQAVGGELI